MSLKQGIKVKEFQSDAQIKNKHFLFKPKEFFYR